MYEAILPRPIVLRMTSRPLALLVLLLAPPPESESLRLRRFFEEHWANRLRESSACPLLC